MIAFQRLLRPCLVAARRRGQLSHQLYTKLRLNGEDSTFTDLLAVDVWSEVTELAQHYEELAGYRDAFEAQPETSVWTPADRWSQL